MGAYRVTTPWTTKATWNTSNGSTAWHTPGGDYANPEKESDAAINSAVGAKTGWTYWYPTRMVQEWYNGTDAPSGQGQSDLGFLLKDVSEGATNNVITFDGREERERNPGLTLEWVQRGVGNATNYTQLPIQLSSTQSLDVNPASGNLSIHSNDLQIASKGLEFDSARNWNSLQNESPGYGYGWVDSNARYVQVMPGGNVAFTDSSGNTFPFIKAGSAFKTPTGIEATMCEAGSPSPCPTSLPSGTSYQLIYTNTGERINFGHKESISSFVYYYVLSAEDSAGEKQTAQYTGAMEYPTAWLDTEKTEIAYTESEATGYTKITAKTNPVRSTSYVEPEGEDGLYHLTLYTNEKGEKTTYRYGGESYLEANLLTEITEPNGTVTKLSYYSDYQIAKIIRTTNAEHTKGPTTSYTYYELGKAPAPCTSTQKATVVTETEGSGEPTFTYCSNVLDEVEIINEKEPPEMPIEPGEEIEDPKEEGEPGIEGGTVAPSLNTTGICAPTPDGYSAACIEATERNAPRTPATETTSPQVNPLSPALVASYQIYIQHTSKYALWGTIRRNKQSYVLGNARNGWHFAKQLEHELGGAADLGTIGSGYKGCGWVYADHIGSKNIGNEPSACEHTPGSENGTFEPKPSAFSSSLDCKKCTGGHPVKLEHGTPVCLNVSPLNKPESSSCNDVDPAKPELEPTKSEQEGKTAPQVNWRYVTREGRWVLVEIADLGIAEGRWAFVQRSALPKTLPTYSN
jgi:hypothetical protein